VSEVAPRRGVWPAGAAAVVVFCVLGLYLGIIVGQGDAEILRVGLVAALLAAAAACCVIACISHDARARAIAAWGGVGALLSLGLLAIFSVGLPLLVAGGLLTGAAIAMGVPKGSASRAAVAFVAGLLVPWALLFL
jgi:hypothetical protein